MIEALVVIPTYWSSDEDCIKSRVFDHPTTDDETLSRLLASMTKQEDRDFDVLILVASPTVKIAKKADKKTLEIVSKFKDDLNIYVAGFETSKIIQQQIRQLGFDNPEHFTNTSSYPGVRNMGILLSKVLGYKIAIHLDDDEVLEDPGFIQKAKEYVGKKHKETLISGIAGVYINPDNSIYIKRNPWKEWYNLIWDKKKWMNKAFKIIEHKQRLNKTTFMFGGNMVLHEYLIKEVPFDPWNTRGEDIDYLYNAGSFGHTILLDNKLAIKHLPPPGKAKDWSKDRQDIIRFAYRRQKMLYMLEKGYSTIKISDTDPYPGYFLRKDLIIRFILSSLLKAFNRLIHLDSEFTEYFNNAYFACFHAVRQARKNRSEYIDFKKQWKNLMEEFDDENKKNIKSSIIS